MRKIRGGGERQNVRECDVRQNGHESDSATKQAKERQCYKTDESATSATKRKRERVKCVIATVRQNGRECNSAAKRARERNATKRATL